MGFKIHLMILIMGVLTVSAMYTPDEGVGVPSEADDFTFIPSQSHHHHNPHIHHSHHHHHNKRREEEDNNNGLDDVDGKRRVHHHQHPHQQEQTIHEEEGHEREHLLQEDSPYYGRYGSENKHNHDHDHVNCHLDESWRGRWFQSGTQNPVLIDSKSIEGKGTCYENLGDKYLFVEKGNCHRCIVINSKHLNVLEYKESQFCEEKSTLENLCSQIPGDAALNSLFRLDSQPIPCPFKGPYTFTYNKGSGLCKNPVSFVDTCTEPSRLLLRYQSCPEVPKSESQVEELQCIGQWKESTYHYLVGKLNYLLAVSNEDRYRCFIYEMVKGHTIVKIAVSGDATCNGLSSPTEGAKTLTFTKVNEGGVKCKFPNWVSSHHWHSLDGKLSVKLNHKNSTMHIADTSLQDTSSPPSSTMRGGGLYNSGNFGNSVTSSGTGNHPYFLFSGGTRITCTATKELTEEHVSIVAQHTEGCTSTTVCMHFYKRHSHVIELQIRKKGSGYYDDYECGKPEALGPSLPYVTLIRAEVNSHRCPYLGKYMASGVTQEGRLVSGGDLCLGGLGGAIQNLQQAQHGAFHQVVVGCGQRATMDFHSRCVTQEPITSYECHGSWEEDGKGFLIASPLSRSSTSARRFCFTYLDTAEGLQFFSSSESCRRDVSPNVEGIWAFNLTVDGQCAEPMTGGGAGSTHCDVFLATLLALLTCGFTFPVSNIIITFPSKLLLLSSHLFYSLFAKISQYSSRERISSPLLTSHKKNQHPASLDQHLHSSSSRRMVLA